MAPVPNSDFEKGQGYGNLSFSYDQRFDINAEVEIVNYMTPDKGTRHSNEVILAFSGKADNVKEAVLSARQLWLELLIAMGSYPNVPGTSYLG